MADVLAGHEAAPGVLRVGHCGCARVRHGDAQTRRGGSAAGGGAGGGGVAGAGEGEHVQDCDDEADAAVVCAERGGGDQVAECGAGADCEAERGRRRPWGGQARGPGMTASCTFIPTVINFVRHCDRRGSDIE